MYVKGIEHLRDHGKCSMPGQPSILSFASAHFLRVLKLDSQVGPASGSL